MKICLLTNIPSEHQIHLAQAFVDLIGEDSFRLIFHRPLSESRATMGWEDNFEQNFIIRFWESTKQQDLTKKWIKESDVVIHGNFPIKYVRQRIRQKQLTFAYQERLWKKGFFRIRHIFRIPHLIKNYWSVNLPNYHFLAAGAYASSDIAKIGCFKNRKWKFGYFIEPQPVPDNKSANSTLEILWCGRLIQFKQPDVVIKFAKLLKQNNVQFRLRIIGDGPLRNSVESKIKNSDLEDFIFMEGWQNKDQIYQKMRRADVFLMTSNGAEGWGVVMNEAMSHGCCIISNDQIGAAPWLIIQAENGLLYRAGDILASGSMILNLVNNKQGCQSLGLKGYQTITQIWSAANAAKRFISLSNAILTAKDANNLYQSGPCSPA